ncbi:MAG: hypothetical protein IH925_03360 [Proteobacteria bacterium]|nr:hypothetical protein [Pseudomonadota bacterium]
MNFGRPWAGRRGQRDPVAGEIAVLPLVFGAREIAALFSVANLVLLRHRIRVEDQALAQRRGE